MKKMIFQSMEDTQKAMEFLEQHDIKYSWNFMNRKYEIHLGSLTTADQINTLIKSTGFNVPFKWGDYYW